MYQVYSTEGTVIQILKSRGGLQSIFRGKILRDLESRVVKSREGNLK